MSTDATTAVVTSVKNTHRPVRVVAAVDERTIARGVEQLAQLFEPRDRRGH